MAQSAALTGGGGSRPWSPAHQHVTMAPVSVWPRVSSGTVCSVRMGRAAAGGTPSSWVGVLAEHRLSNGSEALTGRMAKATRGERKTSA